jgi:hypothetical protein
MPRLFLTPFVIAGLLLLPSCSSAEAKACKAAKEAYISNKEIGDKNINRKTDSSDLGKYKRIGRKAYFVANKIIVNNQKCFTPEQVVKAQIAVE